MLMRVTMMMILGNNKGIYLFMKIQRIIMILMEVIVTIAMIIRIV